ncbi:MAG TPA: hypothetical protein VEH06_14415 [Candidatus Bathyarchaeia archaeon]|nr:hypothetical protein [Candidatus Bathyarchaeia archaeon]
MSNTTAVDYNTLKNPYKNSSHSDFWVRAGVLDLHERDQELFYQQLVTIPDIGQLVTIPDHGQLSICACVTLA